MPPANHYKVLGIAENASLEEIKKAYRQMAFRYHPDHNRGGRGGEEKFNQIREAYKVLSDPLQRRHYDIRLRQTRHIYAPSYEFGKYTQPPKAQAPPEPEEEELPVQEEDTAALQKGILKLVLLVICALLLLWVVISPPSWLKTLLAP